MKKTIYIQEELTPDVVEKLEHGVYFVIHNNGELDVTTGYELKREINCYSHVLFPIEVSEEMIKEVAYDAFTHCKNAHRMYPDNNHTFSDYWDSAKEKFPSLKAGENTLNVSKMFEGAKPMQGAELKALHKAMKKQSESLKAGGK